MSMIQRDPDGFVMCTQCGESAYYSTLCPRKDCKLAAAARKAEADTPRGEMSTDDMLAQVKKVCEQRDRLQSLYDRAVEVQGDDEVMKYITSGNAVPVTRCTVSADLLRQLVDDRRKFAATLQTIRDNAGGGSVEQNAFKLRMIVTTIDAVLPK